jgi:DGQHR domain-containing protein
MATKKTAAKKTAAKTKMLKFPCVKSKQGKFELVAFVTKASILRSFVEINQRDPDEKTGYQRVLSASRVRVIKAYIDAGKPIPTSILISLEEGSKLTHDANTDKWTISIPQSRESGWVIDGQHRLAGASEATTDIELVVVAFIGLSDIEQINQFVTINKEAKGVPTSLYLDLKRNLPHNKTEVERAKDRAVDIAERLKKDEDSPFYSKIIFTGSPKKGELSLNNFVRKVHPLVLTGKGLLAETFTFLEQATILNNYYKAFEQVFPKIFTSDKSPFFRTLGFGALINAFPTVFNLAIKYHQGFAVKDVIMILKKVEDFEFSQWNELGSGNAVEITAGADFAETLKFRFEDGKGSSTVIRL